MRLIRTEQQIVSVYDSSRIPSLEKMSLVILAEAPFR